MKNADISNIEKSVTTVVSEKMCDIQIEACEIGKRSNNLMIYNVEESTSSNVETRIEHDRKLMNKVLAVTKNEHLEVLETHRLGEQQTMNHKKTYNVHF